MSIHTINFYTLDQFSSSIAFNSGETGAHMLGATIEVLSTNVTHLEVEDFGTNFADNQISQYIQQDVVNDGTTYTSGTAIQPEYKLILEDEFGNTYEALVISNTLNGLDQFGMTFIGDVPPAGSTLTVTGYSDIPSVEYSTICLDAATPVLTAQGQKAVGELEVGDLVMTQDHGLQPLRMIIRQTHRFDEASEQHQPVELKRKDATGAIRRIRVSPQHRVLVRDTEGCEVLVPAKALRESGLARSCAGVRRVSYVNLVFDRHEIILANGLAVESFWPGPVGLSQLDLNDIVEVGRIMGHCPTPARPFRRKLSESREPVPLS